MTTRYDLIVAGGGPAGLMAAGQAAGRGMKVLVAEKMRLPARKLGITGKGRCNLTNTADREHFVQAFGSGAKFMRFSLGRFGNLDLMAFFHKLGVETVEERGGRVFPAVQEARAVVRALTDWTLRQGAHIRTRCRVTEILHENNRVTGVIVEQVPGQKPPVTETIPAKNLIIATGGASYPATGSTGDGYALAQSAGHAIVPAVPALVPLETEDDTASRMQGLSLRNVQAELYIQGKKQEHGFGEMLFTHFGVSGPIILTMSRAAVQALKQNLRVELIIDLKPALTHTMLKNRIARVMHQQGRKKLVNILKGFLPLKMIPVFLEKSGLDPEKQGNAVSAGEQKQLRLWCKELRMEITGHRSFHEAIITSGGVKLTQVNPRTMESRKIKGLFFAGEVLDIDAGTGGFNLQAAFTTGWVAGNSSGL